MKKLKTCFKKKGKKSLQVKKNKKKPPELWEKFPTSDAGSFAFTFVVKLFFIILNYSWTVLYWFPLSSWTVPYWPTSGCPANMPPLDFHSRGIPMYHSCYARKAPKYPILNKMIGKGHGLCHIGSCLFCPWNFC